MEGEGFQFLGLEKSNSIVLDIGSAHTKCGFTGEFSPRHILPTEFTLHSGKRLSLSNNEKYTENEWRQAIERLLHKIFFGLLGVGPESNVVIIDSYLYPTIFRKALSHVLFTRFNIETVKFWLKEAAPLLSLPLLPIPPNSAKISISNRFRTTSLVLNVGYSSTRALPIYERLALLGNLQVGVGAQAIFHRLKNLLEEYCPLHHPLNTNQSSLLPSPPMSEKVLEDIIARACFVSKRNPIDFSHFIRSNQRKNVFGINLINNDEQVNKNDHLFQQFQQLIARENEKVDNINYGLSDGRTLEISGFVRSHCADVLFENSSDDFYSIPTLLLDTLLLCPVDTRCELAGSVLLCGGVVTMPGFLTRMIEEVEYLLTTPKYSSISNLSSHINFISSTYPLNTLAWVGGSVIGSLQEECPVVSKAQYQELNFKSIPKWGSLPLRT